MRILKSCSFTPGDYHIERWISETFLKVYDFCWELFLKWCASQGFDPGSPQFSKQWTICHTSLWLGNLRWEPLRGIALRLHHISNLEAWQWAQTLIRLASFEACIWIDQYLTELGTTLGSLSFPQSTHQIPSSVVEVSHLQDFISSLIGLRGQERQSSCADASRIRWSPDYKYKEVTLRPYMGFMVKTSHTKKKALLLSVCC